MSKPIFSRIQIFCTIHCRFKNNSYLCSVNRKKGLLNVLSRSAQGIFRDSAYYRGRRAAKPKVLRLFNTLITYYYVKSRFLAQRFHR